jgi:phosphoribosylanthranilate isomerase
MEYGADAVGFIYNVPSSPRNLEKDDLMKLLGEFPKGILRVIINRADSLSDCIKIMNEINADYYQFHCKFSLREFDRLPGPMRKRIIVGLKINQDNKDSVVNEIIFSFDQFFAFLLDNSEGQGSELDYDLILDVLRKTYGSKIIIAGGINVDNVEYLIKNLKPFGIDASSSLESERGVKDPIKIVKFLDKIKEIKSNMGSEK